MRKLVLASVIAMILSAPDPTLPISAGGPQLLATGNKLSPYQGNEGGGPGKFSSTIKCAKPDKLQSVEVGDSPNHVLAISQSKCTYVKPPDYAGVQSEQGTIRQSNDDTGNGTRYRGYYIDTLTNGDKAYYRYEGSGTLKDGVIQSTQHTWELVGGTGKVAGLKGKGTCKGKGSPDGSLTWQCEGELTPRE